MHLILIGQDPMPSAHAMNLNPLALKSRISCTPTGPGSLDPVRLAEAQDVYSLLDARKRPYSLSAIVREWIPPTETNRKAVPSASQNFLKRITAVSRTFQTSIGTRSDMRLNDSGKRTLPVSRYRKLNLRTLNLYWQR
jgi:hypothetical protein